MGDICSASRYQRNLRRAVDTDLGEIPSCSAALASAELVPVCSASFDFNSRCRRPLRLAIDTLLRAGAYDSCVLQQSFGGGAGTAKAAPLAPATARVSRRRREFAPARPWLSAGLGFSTG